MPTQFVTFAGFMTTADADAHPEHPIFIPPPPNVPAHPIELPPLPPVDPGSGGIPTHPIFIPPGIWGPTDPRPTPPINLGPGGGVGGPPSIWGPTDPRPTPPIFIPDDPAPSPEGGFRYGYSPVYEQWIIVYLPATNEAQPKSSGPTLRKK